MTLDASGMFHPTTMILLHLWPEDVICAGCCRIQNAAVCAAIVFPACRYCGVLSASGHYLFHSFLFCFFEGTCLLKSRNHHRNYLYAAAGHTMSQSFSVCRNQYMTYRHMRTKIALVSYFAHGKVICLFSAGVCMRHSNEPWPPPIL